MLQFSAVNTQRRMAAEALELAHILLLQVMEVLNDTFKLERQADIIQCADEWKTTWTDNREAASQATSTELND